MKNKRSGVVLVMGVFLIFILFGVFSYIYETGRITIAKIKAQNAADAAAVAGQIVYSNMRNNASTNYALTQIYDKMSKNAARWQYAIFLKALKKAYHERDWMVRQSHVWNLLKEEWKNVHHAFHVQDACVSRYFAAYESKVFKFRGIYQPQRVREYILDKWIRDVVNYNLYPVPDEEDVMTDPMLMPYLWKPAIPLATRKYPFVTPWMSGINYRSNNRFPDYSSNSNYVQVDYEQELQLSHLGRFFARVRVYLTPTVFEKFINMNWLNRWNFYITPPGSRLGYIYATAAAQPRVFGNNKVYIYNVTHLPNFMLSIPITGIMGEQDRYFGMPVWPEANIGILPGSDNFNWYWPTITRVIQDENNNPHH